MPAISPGTTIGSVSTKTAASVSKPISGCVSTYAPLAVSPQAVISKVAPTLLETKLNTNKYRGKKESEKLINNEKGNVSDLTKIENTINNTNSVSDYFDSIRAIQQKRFQILWRVKWQ